MQTEIESFRNEVREWLAANFPKSLRNVDVAMMGAAETSVSLPEDAKLWIKRMGEKGWGTPTWPKNYGGGGLTGALARVLQEEMRRAGAINPIGGMGVMMLGPTLLEFANEQQKLEHLPKITTGKVRWCQGFSEPNAGSDLAGLQTRAELDGDSFVVSGQKIWTSGAQYADWCFCLVRTDKTKKHEGISFLLIDMRAPGIEVKPIRLISGASPFCEVFFTDVRVPRENLVGPLNGGWTVAKRLLQHERAGLGGRGGRGPESRPLQDIAKEYVGLDEHGRIADPDLRSRLTAHLMESRAFALTAARVQAESKAGLAGSSSAAGAVTSIMKNAGSRIAQKRAELMLEIMGYRGLGWDGEGFAPDEIEATRNWLWGKAVTIYGGTYEVQNNIIAKRILGLPDPK